MTPEVTTSQSMSDRIKEFRNDPEKMDVTTKFVNEVVEKAKSEALRRMKERDREKANQRVLNTNFEGEHETGTLRQRSSPRLVRRGLKECQGDDALGRIPLISPDRSVGLEDPGGPSDLATLAEKRNREEWGRGPEGREEDGTPGRGDSLAGFWDPFASAARRHKYKPSGREWWPRTCARALT